MVQTKEYKNFDDKSKLFIVNKFIKSLLDYLKSDSYKLYHPVYYYQISAFFKEIRLYIDDKILNKTAYIKTINALSFKKYLLTSIFSVKNEKSVFGNKKIISVFGGKIPLNQTKDKEVLKKFNNEVVEDKTVLIVEANNCHGETIPGFVKYFYDLGYKVNILCLPKIASENPFCLMLREYYKNIYPVLLDTMAKMLASEKLKQYDYVFFNSFNLYYNQISRFKPTAIPEFFEKITKPKYSLLALEHHLDMLNDKWCKQKKMLKLANIKSDALFCNSHYFGEINPTVKNKKTNFIVIGKADSFRRNCNMLFDAVNELISKNITNFKVTFIGARNIFIPDNLKEYMFSLGRLPFDEMYQNIQKSDFIMALLDPDNPEHERYLTCGATGTTQLSYGFLKPVVVHEKFAGTYDFSKDNSIVYTVSLSDAMAKCIDISEDEYEKICKSLNKTRIKIEEESFKNLKEVLDFNR